MRINFKHKWKTSEFLQGIFLEPKINGRSLQTYKTITRYYKQTSLEYFRSWFHLRPYVNGTSKLRRRVDSITNYSERVSRSNRKENNSSWYEWKSLPCWFLKKPYLRDYKWLASYSWSLISTFNKEAWLCCL